MIGLNIFKTVYDFFRYNIPHGIRNIFWFFTTIWVYREWDYIFVLILLKKGLFYLHRTLSENGHEIEETLNPKIDNMKRCLEILDNIIDDVYIDMAEKEVGELSHVSFDFVDSKDYEGCYELEDKRTEEDINQDSKVFKRSTELEDDEWNELFTLLKDGMKGWWD